MAIFTDEHFLFRDSIRKFVESHILPKVDAWERASDFPSEIFQELGARGFLGILIPEEFGGVGGNYALAAAWCEEFGRVPSVGFTTAVNMHSLVITPALTRFGSKEIQEEWVKRAVLGEAIGAYAFTEPNAGSDLSRVQTSAYC